MTTKSGIKPKDNGLSVLTGALSMCICQTEPTTLADCTSLSGSGGKRVTLVHAVSAGDGVLSDGINAESRKVTMPSKVMQDTVQVPVDVSVADLWIAYFDGSELLLKTDQITNQTLLSGGTITTPGVEYGFSQ